MCKRPTVLCILIAALFASSAVQAATTCTASMTDVTFGPSDPFSGWSDVTATITYNCSTFGLSLLAYARVKLCFSIGDGNQGTGTILPRRMTNASSALAFNLYRDPSFTQIWPDSPNTPNKVEVELEYRVPLLGGSGGGSITVHSRIPPGQVTVIPGVFSNTFSTADALLYYQANEALLLWPPWPASCTSGGLISGSTSFDFEARAVVEATCNPAFDITDLDFGLQGLLNTPIDSATTVSPQCTNTIPYQIGLDNGLHAAGNSRRMHDGAGHYVSYELYRDSARTLRWGDTLNTDILQGVGTGQPQPQTIYGRVPPQVTPPQGTYSDTVTVTIYY